MTLDFDEPTFPGNVVLILEAFLEGLDDRLFVAMRTLRTDDPNYSIGVYGTSWEPMPGTAEFLGVDGIDASALQRYTIVIQSMVKDADQVRGITEHTVITEAIRSMLDGNHSLRLELGGLSATVGGITKTLKRWKANRTRFLSNELRGEQIYLSVTDITLEVERS